MLSVVGEWCVAVILHSRCLPGCVFFNAVLDLRHGIQSTTFRHSLHFYLSTFFLSFFLLPPFTVNSFWPHPSLFLPSSAIPFFTFCSFFHIPSHLYESVLFISSECRGSLVHASHRNQFQLRQHNQTKHCTHFSTGIDVTHLSHFLPPAPLLEDILFSLWCHYVNHCRHVVMCECSY